MFAFVNGGSVQQTTTRLPDSARRLDTQEWVMGLGTAPTELVNATGWYTIDDPGAPAYNEATHVLQPREAVYDTQANTVTFTYATRVKTQAELDQDAANAATATERQQARDAIANLDTYIALATPTNAQTVAVVKLLCRICKRLIRDALGAA